MPIVAGVDTSTQSTTVELRDADTGELLGSGRSAHSRTHPPVSEQDPREWWRALKLALDQAVSSAAVGRGDVAAISVSAQCHGLVMLNSAGEPLRAAKLWNDTTSAPQAERLTTEWGSDAWAHAVGSVPIAAFTITKLAWISEHEPELLADLTRVLLPHDYVTFRLTGRAVTDRSDASGTGYYSAHESRWRTDLLERFIGARDWDRVLPTVLGPNEAAGTLSTLAANDLGLRPDVIVGAGGGDQHLGAVGLGLTFGDVAYSLGTSGVVMTVCDTPVFDVSGEVTGVAGATGGYLPLACTLNSTKVTDWAASLLGVDVATLGEMALSTSDPERPVFAAYLDGERTPNRPDARGVLAGLGTATTREQFARSAFEGVLFGLARAHDRLRDLGAAADGSVTVMGGGARSHAYRQILADILDRPVNVRDAEESTARGAAIQAIAVLRGETVADVATALAPAVTVTTEPNQLVSADIRAQYQRTASWTGADRGL